MTRRNLPARGAVEQVQSCAVQNLPPNCIMLLQIAQVQVSTKFLEVSGMTSKATNNRQSESDLCL